MPAISTEKPKAKRGASQVLTVTWKPKPIYKACRTASYGDALAGVLLDPGGWLVATNGVVFVAVPCQFDAPKGFAGALLPPEVVRASAQTAPSYQEAQFLVDLVARRVEASARGGANVVAPLLVGQFPDWRGLLPKAPVKGARTPGHGFSPAAAGQLLDALGKSVVVTPWRTGSPKTPYGFLAVADDGAFGIMLPLEFREEGLHLVALQQSLRAAARVPKAVAAARKMAVAQKSALEAAEAAGRAQYPDAPVWHHDAALNAARRVFEDTQDVAATTAAYVDTLADHRPIGSRATPGKE